MRRSPKCTRALKKMNYVLPWLNSFTFPLLLLNLFLEDLAFFPLIRNGIVNKWNQGRCFETIKFMGLLKLKDN